MKYQYDTSADTAGNYSKTFASKHRKSYKVDNVYLKYPTTFTGGYVTIGVDSDEGAAYDVTLTQPIINNATSGSIYYTGLDLWVEKDDSIVIATTSYPLTGNISTRIGTNTIEP